MTGSDIFHDAFSKYWFEWKEKNRKTIKYIKVRKASKWGKDPSSTGVIVTDLKRKESSFRRISYYKLFNNCTVVKDEKILEKLIIEEVKMKLASR